MIFLKAALFLKDQLKKIRLDFLTAILLLQAIGLLSLYSATHGAHSSNSHLFYRQLIWLGAGWLVFFIVYGIRYRALSALHWPLYGAHIALLALTLFKGEGVRRWLSLGVVNFQPSETLKWALTLTFACLLSQRRRFRKPLDGFELIWSLALILLPLILIVLQPDLGTAGISFLIAASLILFNGIQKKALLIGMALFVISLPLAWSFLLKDYQKNRIISFVNPKKDSKGIGYNVIQSKIAIGSGQFYGKGFAKGSQNQLLFLPERHTDFIFSVISEEYGFFGSMLTAGLFWILIFLILSSAAAARDRLWGVSLPRRRRFFLLARLFEHGHDYGPFSCYRSASAFAFLRRIPHAGGHGLFRACRLCGAPKGAVFKPRLNRRPLSAFSGRFFCGARLTKDRAALKDDAKLSLI